MAPIIDYSVTFCVVRASSSPAQTALKLEHNEKHLVTIPNRSTIPRRDRDATPAVGNDELAIALTLQEDKMQDSSRGFIFGRGPDCDVLLDTDMARGVSRQHFRVDLDLSRSKPNRLNITNLSRNVTTVGTVRLEPCECTRLRSRQPIIIRAGLVYLQLELLSCTSQFSSMLLSNWRRYCERTLQAISAHTKIDPGQMSQAIFNVKDNKIISSTSGEVYLRQRRIGSGASSKVYLTTRLSDNREAAAKVVTVTTNFGRASKEITLLRRFKHDNIIQLLDHACFGQQMWLFLEYAPCGDLARFLRSNGSPGLHEADTREIAIQILQALDYLYKENTSHRDVKPENILVFQRSPPLYKLTDFDLAKSLDGHATATTFCGTLTYCAPEVYPLGSFDVAYAHLADIWSFGHVLWHMLIGKPALSFSKDEHRGMGAHEHCFKKACNWVPDINPNVTESAIDFLRKAMGRDAATRPDAERCLGHPWLSKDLP